ncbi:MAG TPA: hypothetical protein VHK89_03735 [Actinomycetota bacterium]|nr:hypothetical protein [Actinomycetota bacterium]
MHDRDLSAVLRAAAPRPAHAPDVEALWRRAARRRLVGRAVAVALAGALSLAGWAAVSAGLGDRLVDRLAVEPGPRGNSGGGTEPRHERLFLEALDGRSVIVANLLDGTTRSYRVPQLNSGDALFRLELIGSRLVFRGALAGDAARTATFAMDLDLSDLESLGRSWYFVPSATEGRMWLALLDPRSPPTERALAAVKEVTVDGRVTVPRVPLPGRWSTLVGAVTHGLVFQEGRGLVVWDPAVSDVVLRMPGSFAVGTHGSLIAWCDDGCRQLHLSDARSGRDVRVPPGPGFRFRETYFGAFSPDGSQLAVPVSVKGERGTRIALVDVARATARLVEGSRVGRSYGSMTWSTSGERLYANAGGGRIMVYDLATESVEFVSLGVEWFDMAAA